MERCWAEESHQRPEFDEIKSTLLQAKESVEFNFQWKNLWQAFNMILTTCQYDDFRTSVLDKTVVNVGSKPISKSTVRKTSN